MSIRAAPKILQSSCKMLPASWHSPKSRLRIGLVNNMPDAALASTERQFTQLLHRAAQSHYSIHLELLHLPSLLRGIPAREAMRYRYKDAATIDHMNLDGMILTGGAPSQTNLRKEPYWKALASVMDFAARQCLPTLYSCMAAHAGVLHFDNIERQPLPQKLSGVFEIMPDVAGTLLAPVQGLLLSPHSRFNGLDPSALKRAGYKILTSAPEVGADIFVNRDEGLALFTHGHPEYDANSLMLEYRRDLRRFLNGQRQDCPAFPENYFTPAAEAALTMLAQTAAKAPHPELMSQYEAIFEEFRPNANWQTFATTLYRGWLDAVAANARNTHKPAPRGHSQNLRA